MLETCIREATEQDHNFIYNSFLKSLHGTSIYSLITSSTFFQKMHDWLEQKLKTQKCYIICSPDDDFFILGWIVGTPIELSYVYVKEKYRRNDLAAKLLEHLLGNTDKPYRVECNLMTLSGWNLLDHIMSHKYPLLQFIYVPPKF